MFHAGDVAPSSDFLLQLLTPGEVGFVGLHLPLFESPVRIGVKELTGLELGLYAEDVLLALLTPRPRFP
jgi:hypothetical protein